MIKMTREEQREIKKRLNREIAEFLKMQNHYFPKLIQDIKKVLDILMFDQYMQLKVIHKKEKRFFRL